MSDNKTLIIENITVTLQHQIYDFMWRGTFWKRLTDLPAYTYLLSYDAASTMDTGFMDIWVSMVLLWLTAV